MTDDVITLYVDGEPAERSVRRQIEMDGHTYAHAIRVPVDDDDQAVWFAKPHLDQWEHELKAAKN